MKLAASYFGNRMARHVAADMEALRALGCERVVHTFSENDLAYYAGTLREIVALSRDAGLDVALDPWGVARIFGGEAYSHWLLEDPDLAQRGRSGRPLAGACLNHPRLRERLFGWIDAAAATGARRIFWDEPHWVPRGPGNPDGEICACEHCRRIAGTLVKRSPAEIARLRGEAVVRLLAELTAYAERRGLASSICVLPQGVIDQPPLDWDELAGLPGVTEFGTDPYWQAFGIDTPEERDAFIDRHATAALGAAHRAGVECLLWLQAFRVPAGREEDLFAGTRRLLAHQPDCVAIWGFEACAHMSTLACGNPDRVWHGLIDLVRAATPAGDAAGRRSDE